MRWVCPKIGGTLGLWRIYQQQSIGRYLEYDLKMGPLQWRILGGLIPEWLKSRLMLDQLGLCQVIAKIMDGGIPYSQNVSLVFLLKIMEFHQTQI